MLHRGLKPTGTFSFNKFPLRGRRNLDWNGAPFIKATEPKHIARYEALSQRFGHTGTDVGIFTKPTTIKIDKHILNKIPGLIADKILAPSGQYIRKTARSMVRSSPHPSNPGEPPHTQTNLLRDAILWARDPFENYLVVGPSYRRFRTVLAAHEYGRVFRKRKYPERPLMGPASEKAARYLPNIWKKYL